MSDEVDDPRADPVPLDPPRSLSVHERSLIDFLIEGPLGRPELTTQTDSALVTATCSYGCPSVWLQVDQSLPRAHWRDEESSYGSGEAVDLRASHDWRGATQGTNTADVILHVSNGYLCELEIWAGYGVVPDIDVAKLRHCNLL